MAPKASPTSSAIGGEAHGVRQNSNPAMKRILDFIQDGRNGNSPLYRVEAAG